MPKAFKLSILAISVLLIVFVFLGGMFPGGVHATDVNAYQQIEVYSEVLQHIQNDYVVTPDIAKVTTGALHGLLEGLDPDSGYLTPSEFKAYQAQKNESKAQIGVDISKRFGYATVVSVVPGSPADKAGIVDGDVIEAIGNDSTRTIPLQMIQILLDGTPGSQVKFSLIRPTTAAPDEMALTRVMTQYPPLHVDQYENSSILYLRPYDLTNDRVNEVIARLRGMQKNGNQKVLLDLRDVADGDMEPAVRLANAFLKSGTIATLQGQKYPKQTWTANAQDFVTDAPLVVLVNHGTSGAAEIVAAALADNKRADLVGDRTFGTGAVQKQFPLPDGAMIFLSVAKYRTPAGKVIEDDAVMPNVVVPSNSMLAGTTTPPKPDKQLQKALSLLKQKAA